MRVRHSPPPPPLAPDSINHVFLFAPLVVLAAYTSLEAVDTHKAMPHFKLWSDFKASGGCTSVSTKATPLGDWGFQ